MSVLKRLQAGQAEVKAVAPMVYALAPSSPENSCPTPQPTDATAIDGTKIQGGASHVITLEVENGEATPVYLTVGSLAAYPTGFSQFGIAGDNGADKVAFTVNGQNAAGGAQLVTDFATSGGLLLSGIKAFSGSAAQFAKGILMVTVDHNGNSKVLKQRNIVFDNHLNCVSLTGCTLALNASQGFLYEVLAGETVTIELEVLAQGYTVGEYTQNMAL